MRSALSTAGTALAPTGPTIADRVFGEARVLSPRDRARGLFRERHGAVYRYVRSFGLDPSTSEDVTQEVFLALVRHLARPGDDANLEGWVFRVAHNLALRQRAREGRRRLLEAWLPLTPTGADPAPSVEDRLVEAARRGRLHSVLRALPERDRRCVQLRAEGLRYREIAVALDISLGAVAKILARALTRLRRADERGGERRRRS